MMPSHGCSEKYSSNACGALQNAGAPKFARPNQLTEQSQIPKSDPVADPWGGGQRGRSRPPRWLAKLVIRHIFGLQTTTKCTGAAALPGPHWGSVQRSLYLLTCGEGVGCPQETKPLLQSFGPRHPPSPP